MLTFTGTCMKCFCIPDGEQIGQKAILSWPELLAFCQTLLEKVDASERLNLLKTTADSDGSNLPHLTQIVW